MEKLLCRLKPIKRAKTLIDDMQPKAWMDYMFDHTVIVAKDDEYLDYFMKLVYDNFHN